MKKLEILNKRGKHEGQLCPLCGERPANSRDHVPPKSIFLRQLPTDLITVRVCKECNNEASKLDQEFAVYLSIFMGMDTLDHQMFWKDKALRSVRKNNKLRERLLQEMRPAYIKSPGGIIVGKGNAVPWQVKSHRLFIRRLTRGLYRHHFGDRLASEADISVDVLQELDAPFKDLLLSCKNNSIGGSQFKYWHGRVENEPKASVWFYLFHKAHLVIAISTPPNISTIKHAQAG